MLSVDSSQVTAADCRRTHGENHLTASGTRIGNLANIDLTSTWEENTAHNDSVPANAILAFCHSQLSTASALTVGAGDGRGISHELTGLPRGPERLDKLGPELVGETDGHPHPNILGCCDDR